jgi:acetyl esterase/lipase
MMLVRLLLPLALLAPLSAQRNIPYAQPANERQLLDVFAPARGAGHPVAVWIHGGGWMRGSKEEVGHKPAAFTAQGMVFVPINYRFVPHVPMEDIVRDAARAVAWVHANIAKHGGDPTRIFLMGHSAGAQLAALLCTDTRYLEAERVPRHVIRGCVPVDGDTYDVPLQVATATARRLSLKQPPPRLGHPEKFGPLPNQRELSAGNHVVPHRGIAPFLILHVADHPDTAAQAYRLWAALDAAGIPATRFAAENSDHVKLDADLGLPNDLATQALFAFTTEVLNKPSSR